MVAQTEKLNTTISAWQDWIIASMTQEMIDIARDFDDDAIIEALKAHRIAFDPF